MHSTLLPVLLLLVLTRNRCGSGSWSLALNSDEHCQLPEGSMLALECTGLYMGLSSTDASLPRAITDKLDALSRITRLQIRDSNVSHLNLDALAPFEALIHLDVSNSRVRRVNVARDFNALNLTSQLRSLNLSNNFLLALDLPSLFPVRFDVGVNDTPIAVAALEELDLSYNLLTNISLKPFPALRRLGLHKNNFTCPWVRTELYDWWQVDPTSHTLLEANSTLCEASEIAFDSIPFPVALLQKKRGVEECEATTCSCDVRGYFINKLPNPTFPTVYSSPELNVTITLNVDCGNMSLTELPNITAFATVLSVQHNAIRSLDRISVDPDYRNLVGLDLSYNALDSLDFLGESRFTDSFHFIALNGNQFHQIPEHIITQIFKETRKSLMRIKLGQNEIDCDCFTHTKLRPLLIRNEKVIDDWRNISCRTPVKKSLLDLKRADVCSNTGDPAAGTASLDFLWYALIALESLLIIAIVGKVWYDARQYRATGTLPKCSLCIPRLPCDFMLEGLKDSKHHGPHDQHNGHGHGHGQGHSHSRSRSLSQGQLSMNVAVVGNRRQAQDQGHRDRAQNQKLLESNA